MLFVESNLGATIFYGFVVAITGILSVLSKQAPLQKVALLMVFSWGISNFLFDTMSPPHLLAWNARMDAVLGALAFLALRGNHTPKARSLVSLIYISMLSCHFGWLLFYRGANYGPYFWTQNLLFLSLAAIISGGSISAMVGHHSIRHGSDHGGDPVHLGG